ncbi:MAG: transketolase [Candidatus Nanopelagicales bacterium]
MSLDWTDLDRQAVDTIRVLAMDAVQKVGNGHPGTAMSLAPATYLLWQRFLRHDPTDPGWAGRDRFVLSCGHSSLTLYIQLFLSGYGLELSDLESLRTWGSKTPGHPEHGHTIGVETTTGPLGQGVGNAVGMAMAARRERGLLDPDADPGTSPFDHTIWCFASDGDLEEGVSSETSSLAATQRLGNLVLLWDDNHISIEDDTNIAFTEDPVARYAAYGWHVQTVRWLSDDGAYEENVQALADAYDAALAVTDRPSFIALRTIIGWPAPTLQDTYKAHGSALGEDEVRAAKEILGWNPDHHFEVPPDALAHARHVIERGRALHREWDTGYRAWRAANPERAALHDRLRERRLPDGWQDWFPTFDADPKGMATRKASGAVLNAIAPRLPELWGGSADLAESTNTTPKGEPSFLPADRQSKEFEGGPYGRVLHFGIREHGMGSILNGIALHGGTRPYGATFLVFSDYMRPAVRLAALMKLPVTYVWTHDSVGLGEDGPTHQPIEQVAALRGIPGLDLVRPADANETAVAWRTVLGHTDRPAGIALTRQNVPVFDRSELASADLVAKGGYVLADATNGVRPQVILIATGSEVQVALAARGRLQGEGVPTRVVSMPCVEWFREQTQAYRDTVLIPDVKARVSVEAGIAQPWWEWVGSAGRCVSIEHFGASADYQTLFYEFGFTAENVVVKAHESLAAAGERIQPT